MNIIIKLLGMWLFSEAIFSLHTYWKEDNLFDFGQSIRWIRLITGIFLMVMG